MNDESIGRGERQARALVIIVLVIESLWVFFHKYLPIDAGLWALQSDAVRLHISGSVKDGLTMIPLPAANTFVPLISGLLSFLLSSEVITRLLIVFVGILLRGMVMLSLLRVMRVREALVYFLVPVFVWSGVFFIGSMPYLIAETLGMALITHLLKQDQPRNTTFWVLAIGFAIVAWSHALAFVSIIALVIAVANEQRRSVHLSQGWLSNMSRVTSLVLPGFVVLLLRIFYPAPIFMLSTSGLIPSGGAMHLLFAATISPVVLEAGFPGSDIIAISITTTVILLVLASLARAFLLPMEEVSWQSRSTKGAGGVLLILSLLSVFLTPLGIETSAFLWLSAFLLVAGSYSRGPAVRRGAVDGLLRTIGFIVMIAAGLYNGISTNRGSEAADDIRNSATKIVRGEVNKAKIDERIEPVTVRFVLTPELLNQWEAPLIARFSYSASMPIYLYEHGSLISNPSMFQPEAGILQRSENTPNGVSPTSPIFFNSPEMYFDPHFRVLAALPAGATTSSAFGPFTKGFIETTNVKMEFGSVVYDLGIGKLSPHPVTGLAELQTK
ncbi:MAG: hypothetical protein WCH46_05370 [bacterium]